MTSDHGSVAKRFGPGLIGTVLAVMAAVGVLASNLAAQQPGGKPRRAESNHRAVRAGPPRVRERALGVLHAHEQPVSAGRPREAAGQICGWRAGGRG